MNFIFLMDPLETVQIDKDTTFILMLEASLRGHKVYYLADGGMTRKNNQTFFDVLEVVPQRLEKQPFVRKKERVLGEPEVDIIFVRNDPPFDGQYLLNTWLLDLISSRIPVINRPSGIRTVNEKIWATQFTSLVPRTVISRSKKVLRQFLIEEKEIVAKPTNGFGGQLVFRVKKNDTNANVILESLTENHTREIIAQKYVPAARKGDKRILLLNGEPLGAVLRVHAPGEHRNNLFAGGQAQASRITSRDQEIVRELKPHLLSLGLYLVGIDILGGYLIEVNVTSPTCLQEINKLDRVRLETKVIDFAEKIIDQGKVKRKMG